MIRRSIIILVFDGKRLKIYIYVCAQSTFADLVNYFNHRLSLLLYLLQS